MTAGANDRRRRSPRHIPAWLALAAAFLAPAVARADRGALTLEGGPSLAVAPRVAPPVPGAAGLALATLGASLGLGYAVSNHLEVAVAGVYELPAGCSAAVVDPRGVVVANVSAAASGWGAEAGLRYLSGLTWRLRMGASLGWFHRAFSRVEVTGPRTSAALPAALPARETLSAAVAAGLFWQVDDHLGVGAALRLEVLLGGPATVAFALPVTVGYSWYFL